MSDLDALFTITCGRCDTTSLLAEWIHVGTQPLPVNVFRCPHCKRVFTRQRRENQQSWEKFYELVEDRPAVYHKDMGATKGGG